MESISIDKIGYFSFTRKAANEARDRAIEKFGLDKKSFKWFSTLHSCGYHSINQEGRTVMGKPQFKSFADKIGLKSRLHMDVETGMSDNIYLNQHNLARARGISLEEHYRKYVDNTEIEWRYLQYVSEAYDEFKEVNKYTKIGWKLRGEFRVEQDRYFQALSLKSNEHTWSPEPISP